MGGPPWERVSNMFCRQHRLVTDLEAVDGQRQWPPPPWRQPHSLPAAAATTLSLEELLGAGSHQRWGRGLPAVE
jgi:hypothetical protein